MDFLRISAGPSSQQVKKNDVKTMSEKPEQMPDNVTHQPLVTFALFAYNQEDLIREAVEGALAQTYEPLEIILSDDCSTDRTFEIMRDIATEYDGAHKIVLRQNSKNLGIGGHVAAIGDVANGEWIVMAAGDDISYPERTEKLMSTANSNRGSTAVFSAYFPIIENFRGRLKGNLTWSKVPLFELACTAGGAGKGATYAYRKDCFYWPCCLPDWVINEDRVLPFRAAILGHVIHCPEPLILYRQAGTEFAEPAKLKRERLEGNPRHWALLRQHVTAATTQNRISRIQAKLACLALRISETFHKKSGSGPHSQSIKLQFLALRMGKKLAQAWCNFGFNKT